MPYIGSTPTKVVSRQSATVYRYTATAGQTVFSGADLDNNVLACNPADMIVHMNGLRLESTDYTATSTTVTLTTAATAGDEVTVTSFQTFEVADTYTKTAADNRYVNTTGDTMTGALGIGTTTLNSNKVVIEGGNAGTHSSNLKLTTGSSASGLVSDLSFYGTFVTPTADKGPRRTADITSGYATANWGNEYLAFGVGGATDYANLTTERMRIDGAGRVTMPYQPGYMASGGQSVVSSGTEVKYSNVAFNVGNNYNSANGRFTAPVDGTYVVGCYIQAHTTTHQTYTSIVFRKNGSNYGPIELVQTWAGGTDHTNTGGVILMQLNSGDYADIYASRGYRGIQGHSFAYLLG